MRWILILLIAIFSFPLADACINPFNGIEIRENAVFCHGTYNIEKGINILEDHLFIDCNNSILIGNGVGYGILVKGRQNIYVQNCNISNYETGIYLDSSGNISLKKNYLGKNKFGIALQNSIGNDIDDNDFFGNVQDKIITDISIPQEANQEINYPKKALNDKSINQSPLQKIEVRNQIEDKSKIYYLIYLAAFLLLALAFYILYYRFYSERRKLK